MEFTADRRGPTNGEITVPTVYIPDPALAARLERLAQRLGLSPSATLALALDRLRAEPTASEDAPPRVTSPTRGHEAVRAQLDRLLAGRRPLPDGEVVAQPGSRVR